VPIGQPSQLSADQSQLSSTEVSRHQQWRHS